MADNSLSQRACHLRAILHLIANKTFSENKLPNITDQTVTRQHSFSFNTTFLCALQFFFFENIKTPKYEVCLRYL